MRPFFLAASLLLIPACATEGFRAQNGCPIGVTCSNQTPKGLDFGGPSFGDTQLFDWGAGVKPVAVGGHELVDVYDHATGAPLDVSFTAAFDGPELSVAASGGGEVGVQGQSEGTAVLQLTDHAGLLDEVQMHAAPIATIALTANGDHLAPYTTTLKLWTGSYAQLTVELSDANGIRLVDDTLHIAPTQAAAQLYSWDSFEQTVDASGASATVTAGGGAPTPVSLPAVSTLDSIDMETLETNDDGSTTGLAFQVVCLHGHSGADEVVGVPWSYTLAGPAHSVDQNGSVGGLFGRNCIDLQLDAAGTVTVTASAAGLTSTLSFDATPTTGQKRAAKVDTAQPALTPGERAGGF